MKKTIILPNWSKSEEIDLNVLMREVLSFSRAWVDIHMNKLVDMGVPFSYEQMKPKDSTSEDDQRTVNDVRIHADEESQAPKRRKNTPGEVKARGKKIEEVKKKKHKTIIPPPINPSPPLSVSSIKVIEVREQNKETQQWSNTVILPENIQELYATTTSAPPNENDDQPRSPIILLEVSLGNEIYDLTKSNPNDDDDVISALRGLDREMCFDDGMEMAAILDWLMRSMEKSKKMIEVQPIDNIDDYLARSAKEKEPKRAEILSHIARDETGMQIVQVVVPITGVTTNIATPMDFQITFVALGRTSREQEFQEVGDNLKVIDARLDREIAEKERHREENIKLREYIVGIRCENLMLISSIAVDHGIYSHYEATSDTLSEVERWIESTRKQADDFLTQIV